LIIGFHVRATPRASDLADAQRVEIKYYSIIYDVIDEVRAAMEGLLSPDRIEEITGRAEVRNVFKISRVGAVAGCMVLTGKIARSNMARVLRGDKVVHSGKIRSIRRHKDEVSDINEGFECGIALEGFNDLNVGDQIEAFEVKEIARKL
jgi:translation initiation factor IF-2